MPQYALEPPPPPAVTAQVPAVTPSLAAVQEKAPIAAEIAQFIEQQPEDVAMLLRSWMNEEQRGKEV